jgi:metal-sulfur cluster biosynthetic enzyme
MFAKKRLLIAASGITAIAAAGAMVAGATFGLFSSQAPSTASTFSAGTVTVSNGATSAPCAVTNLVPGDTSATNVAPDVPCTFVINDASTVPAYAAVDVFIAATKGTSGVAYGGSDPTALGLYDGTNSTGLNVTISDGSNPFTVPMTANAETCPTTGVFAAAATGASKCYEIDNLLLSASAVGPDASPTTISTLTVTWSLPSTSTNAYEGASATIQFNAHEVQAAHNSLPGSCTTVGAQCADTTGFQWES